MDQRFTIGEELLTATVN